MVLAQTVDLADIRWGRGHQGQLAFLEIKRFDGVVLAQTVDLADLRGGERTAGAACLPRNKTSA